MPGTGVIKVEQCSLGDTIRFKTINTFDINVYSGKIIGIVDFERARTYGDVAATHLQMEQSASQLGMDDLIDVTQQKFLIVTLSNGDITPYAFEWLTDRNGNKGVVEKIEVGYTYTIRLYNVSADEAGQAVNQLKSSGYVCKLLKKASSGQIVQ